MALDLIDYEQKARDAVKAGGFKSEVQHPSQIS